MCYYEILMEEKRTNGQPGPVRKEEVRTDCSIEEQVGSVRRRSRKECGQKRVGETKHKERKRNIKVSRLACLCSEFRGVDLWAGLHIHFFLGSSGNKHETNPPRSLTQVPEMQVQQALHR